ncbi:hypothetical protein [Pseudomonas lundensis]|uniref:hypothetical protein n=1 Tax=Pseudomonas lundensis TaxID=86185 RepID=UPI001474F489|nr:hypothetical protein [Pseudomonas lundensis]NNA01928.1 hypothetical protein [Pseudomonas lundensis]
MSIIEPSGNTAEAHVSNKPQSRSNHQSAAMHAALLVRYQYSRESKTQFRRECLNHLKASLSRGQEAFA